VLSEQGPDNVKPVWSRHLVMQFIDIVVYVLANFIYFVHVEGHSQLLLGVEMVGIILGVFEEKVVFILVLIISFLHLVLSELIDVFSISLFHLLELLLYL